MQALVKCEDTSYCVIYERSIVKGRGSETAAKGSVITFKWPEDNQIPQLYSGEIVEISSKHLFNHFLFLYISIMYILLMYISLMYILLMYISLMYIFLLLVGFFNLHIIIWRLNTILYIIFTL